MYIQVGLGGLSKMLQTIDPYVTVDIDDTAVAKTQTRTKTSSPSWSEEFSIKVHNGQQLGFTVFHDAVLPPDVFVADCKLAIEDIANKPPADMWVCMRKSWPLFLHFHVVFN